MLNKFLSAAFLLVVLFTSCKKDVPQMLEGTWQGQEYSTDMDTKDLSPAVIKGAQDVVKSTFYTFNADGTFIESVFKIESTGKWLYNDSSKMLKLVYSDIQGPLDRNPQFEVISITSEELKVKNKLTGKNYEYYTFIKK
ncbi:MAG TPA: lipocalin family protein [Bacteroidia bacterium]|nr:lipocalin family protein [Bacteroidia bacterium]